MEMQSLQTTDTEKSRQTCAAPPTPPANSYTAIL